LALLDDVAGTHVLDAACGPGHYAAELVEQGAQFTGLGGAVSRPRLGRYRDPSRSARMTPEDLADVAALAAALPPYDEAATLSLTERLRAAGHPPDLIAAALTQNRLRARAVPKFGALAARLFFTADGLEQATRRIVAEHRVRRFAALPTGRVADLCCGIGGDTLAFAAAGIDVLAVDNDPSTTAMVVANAAALGLAHRVQVRCADVTSIDPGAAGCDAAFVDPARRTERGRVFDPTSYSPPLAFVAQLASKLPTAAKVSPGLPHTSIPSAAEAEWVSVDGDVVETTLWFGGLRSAADRRATVLPSARSLVADPSLSPPPVGGVQRWLYEPDGAVLRAGLVAEVAAIVDGSLLDPSIAYVTSGTLLDTPFATAYEVHDVLPFSVKRLQTYVRQHRIGVLEVKKRGTAVTPEALRAQLRLSGGNRATVVLTRLAGNQVAIVVERIT
jgi:SAM-dependent methyltransferase